MKKWICMILCCLLGISCLTACGGGKDDTDTVKILWYGYMYKQNTNDAVFARANEIVKEKLGFEIDIVALEDYSQKMQVINAGGEDYDIMFTASYTNSYYQNVADGNLLALDALLPEEAPELWNSMDEAIWDGVRVNGKIYAVPNQQIFARSPCISVPTVNLEKMGIDPADYADKKFWDYGEYLKKCKEVTGTNVKLPDVWGAGGYQFYGFEEITGGNLPGAIRFDEENPKIVNQYESEEYKQYIKLRREWNQQGLTAQERTDESMLKDYESYTKSGKAVPFMLAGGTWKPGYETEQEQRYSVPLTTLTKTEPLLTTYGITATMQGISARSKHPKEAVRFLNLLNTDKELYNLLCFGIEGENYEKLADNRIKPSDTNKYAARAWAIGNVFNSFLLEAQDDNVWEDTKKINAEAQRSPVLGFAPDLDDIKLEMVNCTSVCEEYLTLLGQGLLDVDTSYDAFIAKLKTAGVDTMIEKLQKQLDAWNER